MAVTEVKGTGSGGGLPLGGGSAPPEKDRKGYYLFINLETQGANLTYAWDGKIYTYEDGQVYQMTPAQAAHLNSLSVMQYDLQPDASGQMRSVPVGRRPRFSVREVTPGEVERQRQELAGQAANL
ncbi:MAG: hypothetical protein C4524_07365 [Candidatus Zixiibacteriota bacterium]|nr:MAG: hypothetical protein C4524_07365 [candidate division Zixibacteria bacterium]